MKNTLLKADRRPLAGLDSSEDIDAAFLGWARSLGCEDIAFSSLIPTHQLKQAGYLDAFPQLVMYARAGTDAAPPDYALSPAVCYHAYVRWAGRVLDSPVRLTAKGLCFRNERECQPGRRQIEFRMRELIFIGQPDAIDAALNGAEEAIKEGAAAARIDGSWAPASDPFFLPVSRGRALMQRLLNTKREFCLSDGLALASINRHRSFFGERFSIRTSDGAFAHSACIAFGLERWKTALTGRTKDNGATP